MDADREGARGTFQRGLTVGLAASGWVAAGVLLVATVAASDREAIYVTLPPTTSTTSGTAAVAVPAPPAPPPPATPGPEGPLRVQPAQVEPAATVVSSSPAPAPGSLRSPGGRGYARVVRGAIAADALSCFVDDEAGRARVSIHVDSTGRIVQARAGRDTSDGEISSCIGAAVIGERVPPPPGRHPARVDVEFVNRRGA